MRQHGWFTLERHDRIVVFRLFDAWNLETANAYLGEIDAYCPDPATGPWAFINDLRRWGFSSLELMAPIQERAAINAPSSEFGSSGAATAVGRAGSDFASSIILLK